MTPPRFSKPKPAATWQENKRRNYEHVHSIKPKEGRPEPRPGREVEIGPHRSTRDVWDNSAKDKASFKLWLIANNRKA